VNRLSATIIVLGVLAARPAGAQVNWTFRGPVVPISRVENAMVYDSGNQRMVVFGGYDLNFNRTNDVWEYSVVGSTRTWTNVSTTGPIARQGAAMAYDPLRDRILMFGGSDDAGTVLGDTWEWNTVAKTWSQLSLSPSPPPRVGSRMVYDVANDRIVLQGGWNSTTSVTFSDTWEWDPVSRTWSNLNPGVSSGTGRPFSARTYHGLVYNTTNDRVTIFGGRGASDLNDLWELQGNTWVDVTPGGTLPPGRGWSGVTYESANDRLVLYGGWNNTGQFSYIDTWAWNGSSWTQLPNGPTARDSHAMVWDPVRGVSMVFGGFSADVRELVGSTWTGPFNDVRWPPSDDDHSIAYDPSTAAGHRRIFLYGGGSVCPGCTVQVWETFHFGNNNGTLTWRFPWTFANTSSVPGGRIGHAMVWESSRNRAVLFGGRQRINGAPTGTVFGDTWSFTRTPAVLDATWTNLASGGPPPRYDHQMVYDAGRDRIVMFGGRSAAGTPLADTWIWNGSSWSAGPAGPSARFDHAMAYDSVRGVVVLFGGDTGTVKLGDTWEWNGSSWALRATTGASPRSGAALSEYGSPCGGVMLFGGRAPTNALLQDHWFWSGTAWSNGGFLATRPSPRENARMLYDPAEGRLWLFGGLTMAGRSGEMWTGTVVSTSGSFSIDDVTVAEGSAGTTGATFTVSLSPLLPSGASVNYATADGSATGGSDYVASSGTAVFGACQGAAVVTVPVIGDLVDEPNETFLVNLSSPSGGVIVDGQGQGTITDDDPTPEVIVEDCAVGEGNSSSRPCPFGLRLSNPSASTVTLNYATANGSALSGSDYTTASGGVSFPPLTTGPQTVNVSVLGDSSIEGDETFVLNLSGASGATLPDPQGQGTILDDDAPSLASNELVHGAVQTADLAADPGPIADVDYYRLGQDPRASYEVVLDATSGDVVPAVLLERLASNNTTILQTAVNVGTGSSKSLRWENLLPAKVTAQHIRVRNAGCGVTCGPEDVYRIRAYETTYSIPRFNNSASQVTVLLIQNAASYTINGRAYFWDTAGALLYIQPFSLAPKALFGMGTSTVVALQGKGGTITVSNDGRYGDLAGKAIALEPATGFSFDSVMEPRPR
jgi:hypothetical protein